MEKRVLTLNEKRNVKLVCYLHSVSEEYGNANVRPAVIILPGGGYEMCSAREADPVAQMYLQAGYQVFILYYSLKEHAVWPNPLEDYDQAAEQILSHAEEWNVIPDKLAVIGFSAGGHLAACAASAAKHRPSAVLLGYPVITKETVSTYNAEAPGADELVTPETSPVFLFAGRNDWIVPVSNTLAMTNALVRNNVTCECHIYGKGAHGFSTCESSLQDQSGLCSRTANWKKDSLEWLKDILGELTPAGMGKPAVRRNVTGDTDKTMSIDCTFGHLAQSEAAMQILMPLLQQGTAIGAADPAEPEKSMENIFSMIQNMTIRDMLSYSNASEETAEKLDEALRQIPNTL